MQIIGCQLDIVWEDKPANYAKVEEMLARMRPEPGSMVVLPEMFSITARPESGSGAWLASSFR